MKLDPALQERLRERIERHKERLGFTLEALAKRSRVPRGTLVNILYAESCNPTLDTLVKLARVFEVPIVLFLDGVCDDPIMFGTGYETRPTKETS